MAPNGPEYAVVFHGAAMAGGTVTTINPAYTQAELEAVLLRHPDVDDAAVIGLPDDEAGEIPAGYIVLRPGAAASPAEIMRFVAGEVAHYKQIRRLGVIDAIPKSAAGKILRRVLRDSART